MRITFETETCGRCGGTGEYSYNQIDGKRCYGCGGTGTRLSRNGQLARKAYDTAREALETRPVTEVKPGDYVWAWRRASFGDSKHIWRPVQRIYEWRVGEPDGLGSWNSNDRDATFLVLELNHRKNAVEGEPPIREGFARSEGTIRVYPGRDAMRDLKRDIARRFSGATLVEEETPAEAPEAPQEAPAEPTGPQGGKPVYHVRTGALVGWLTKAQFVPVAN